MFNSLLALFILFTLNTVGKRLAKQHRRTYFALWINATRAQMDALKVEIGKMLMPVVESWLDIPVITEADLIW